MINDELKARVRQVARATAKDLQNDPSVTDGLVNLFCKKVHKDTFGSWVNDYTELVVDHFQFTATIEDTLLKSISDAVFTDAAKKFYERF